jgi:serine phosphatase RsbU (regulator of sigma subunit)
MQNIVGLATPRKEDYPQLGNIDYFAKTIPLEGRVGGDHLMFVHFEKLAREVDISLEGSGDRNRIVESILSKNRGKFGMAIIDVFGHAIADSIPHYFLHAAITASLPYELIRHQEVTQGLFEKLNTMWYKYVSNSSMMRIPLATLLYGEVYESGKFRFLSAGHPPPIIYSNLHDKVVALEDKYTISSTPLGMLPSEYRANTKHFRVNEITLLGQGDILLLYSDGFIEQENGHKNFAQTRLGDVLKNVKNYSAKDIYHSLLSELHAYSPVQDDLTLAVIKKK